MSGTKTGGLKAVATNKKKYGKDFYVRIGRKGGKLGKTGGFWADSELARRAGAIGGSRSKSGKKMIDIDIFGRPIYVKKDVNQK